MNVLDICTSSTTGKLACPRHFERLCECPPSQKVIKYRYTLPELEGMLSSLAAQAAAYTSWVDRVEAVLDSPDNSKTGESECVCIQCGLLYIYSI